MCEYHLGDTDQIFSSCVISCSSNYVQYVSSQSQLDLDSVNQYVLLSHLHCKKYRWKNSGDGTEISKVDSLVCSNRNTKFSKNANIE